MFMHICMFFDDVIQPPWPAEPFVWHKIFFRFKAIFWIFWGVVDFLAFLDPKLGPMNGKLIKEIPCIFLADR